MTPAINQHWFQTALLGVSTVFYPLLADVLLLASLVQRAVKLLWNEQLQLECLSCWICCGKQNWTTTNKLFHADSFQRKNLFWRSCWGSGICHLVTTLTLGKNANSISSQQGAFQSHLEVKIQPSLWWAVIGEEIEWVMSLTFPCHSLFHHSHYLSHISQCFCAGLMCWGGGSL